MGSIFSKIVRNSGPTDHQKVREWWESDVSKAFRAFVSAKMIAGGPGTFWTEEKHQKKINYPSVALTRHFLQPSFRAFIHKVH